MKLLKSVMIAVFVFSCALLANAQMLTYDLRSEADAYAAGEVIARGVAMGLVYGLADSDGDLGYAIHTEQDKLTVDKTTWPVVNVTIEIDSDILPIEEITFTLALEAAPATKSKYYVVGTILFTQVNGMDDETLAELDGVMFAETADDIVEIQLVNGKPVIVN